MLHALFKLKASSGDLFELKLLIEERLEGERQKIREAFRAGRLHCVPIPPMEKPEPAHD